MSKARMEILKLIAEGKISPEEGERLLDALKESEEQAQEKHPPFGEAVGQVLEDIGETVRRAVDDALGTAQRVFEEHHGATESVEIGGGSFELPAGSRLRVQQAMRVSLGGGSKGGNVILGTGDPGKVRIARGEAVEVHRNGSDYVLTWAKGNLELEIPPDLNALEVRCLGGDLEVRRFPGPMSLDTAGGELRVLAPSAPFRFRSLGGRIRIADLDLRDGSSSISSTGGEVNLHLAEAASVTIHASSLGGTIEFPPGIEPETQGKARRHADCVVGRGEAQLKIDTLGGNIRVRKGATS